MKHKKWSRALSAVVAICLASSALQAVKAEAVVTTVYINEVESSDANGGNDWVEIVNSGSEAVDVSGWYITDDKGTERVDEGSAYPIPQGTVLEAGAVLVLEETVNFDFGLGKEDAVTLYDAEGNALDTYSWSGHAEGTYSRTESGEFVDMAPTKGGENTAEEPEQSAEATVVINEVNSSPDDYVELMNLGQETLDLTGFELRDNSDDHRWQFPAGTTLAAGELLLVKADSLGLVFEDQTDTYVEGTFAEAIGIGSGDAIRLYDGAGRLLDSHSWTEHANVDGDESASWGRYPDGTGAFVLMPETAGAANSWYAPGAADGSADIPEVESWPGDQSITASDLSFLEDSSGLDIHDGKLYAVDNGTGKFWILDMAADGTLSFAEGFENGKTVNFASRDSAKGPDTEGITVDGDGYVYLASERDNSDKGVNFNVIIMADPDAEGDALVAIREWDLTASLPDVAANTGIEAVEWVSNGELAGKLFDRNTNDVFDGANYPDAVAGGVFFVALEDNGHVYAYVLNADGSSIQIADLDPMLGGAMALDYDTYEHQLWVVADDGFGNMAAKLTFNGKAEPQIVHIAPPSGLDVTMNNEGFAIADASYTVDGLRPVYRFIDGVISGSLTIGYIDRDYVAEAPHTHSFTNYVSNGDATCEADGTKTAKCDGCDETDTVVDVGSRKGHTYEDGKCVDCGAEEQEQIPVTGDGTDVYPWLALLSGALLMLTILWDAKKQRI